MTPDDLGPRGWPDCEAGAAAADAPPPVAETPPPRRRGRPRKTADIVPFPPAEMPARSAAEATDEASWVAKAPEETLHGQVLAALRDTGLPQPQEEARAAILCSRYLRSSATTVAPLTAEAEILGVSRYMLPQYIATLASSTFEVSKSCLAAFFARVVQSFTEGFRPVAVVQNLVYDETPSSIRVPDEECCK